MSGAETDRLTPARRQYLEIKAQCPPDALLLYRMGDFYETFDDDAYRAAEALHITLTSREFGRGERVAQAVAGGVRGCPRCGAGGSGR